MDKDSIAHSSSKSILFVGDINNVFLDSASVQHAGYEIQKNILDAIDRASQKHFDAIAVVMNSVEGDLTSVLKALRQTDKSTKIVLLAQMIEEPLALRFSNSDTNGSNLADDYLICPLETDSIRKLIFEQEQIHYNIADNAIEAKIRMLEELATTDELTGLKNRRYIWEFARQIIERAKKLDGRVTLLIFDIDNFKHYNDVYSHSAGDEILKQAAVLMARCCRSHDVVGRIGGDEFAVIFWDDPSLSSDAGSERRSSISDHPNEAVFIAKRFRAELNRAELHLLGPEGQGVLTISGGLASFPRDGNSINELFKQADNALLDAKRSGKNRINLVGASADDIANIEE